REAVQDEALPRVRLLEPVLDHLDDEVVGHELPGVHVGLRLLAQFRVLRHVVTEDIPGGNSRDPEVDRELLGLSPFAGPGGTEEDESHRTRDKELFGQKTLVREITFRGVATTAGGWSRKSMRRVFGRPLLANCDLLPDIENGMDRRVPNVHSGGRHRPPRTHRRYWSCKSGSSGPDTSAGRWRDCSPMRGMTSPSPIRGDRTP